MLKKAVIIVVIFLSLYSCKEIQPDFPDEPVIDYLGFSFLMMTDQLGNSTLTGRLSFEFTDGDGNLGLYPLSEESGIFLPDSVKYNFFLQLYDLQGFEFVKVPEDEGGILKYRIPYLDKQPLSGTIDLDISYPLIVHDTIFYTFYIYDRDYNRSNTDTTETIILRNIVLDSI